MTTSAKARVTLPGDEQILIEREFAAPRQLVYRAWTEPELVKLWWSGRRGEVTSCEIDLRVGGMWRYVMEANEGFEVAFHGEYREIVPEERIVSTEVFEGMPDAQALNTVTFTDTGGHTAVEILVLHSSKEHRDAHINSGMEVGLQEAMDLLEEVAVSLADSAVQRDDPLAALEPFVGEWSLEAVMPQMPPTDLRGRVTFEWLPGGGFLVGRWEIPFPAAPNGLAVIGFDSDRGTYLQHHFDSRGVARVYEMGFEDRVWTLSRGEADFSPLDFAQRWKGQFSADGTTIVGSWETLRDGARWEHDFDLRYERIG